MIVLNDEVLRSTSSSATSYFATELRKAISYETDNAFLNTIAASTGITTNASSGLNAAQFLADLNDALQAIETDSGSKLYLIVPAGVAKSIAFLCNTSSSLLFPEMKATGGGMIQGIRVVVSSAATDWTVH